jgi:hypothetical protein
VAIPDDEPTYTNPLLEGQRPVEVGVHNLTEFAGHVRTIWMNSIGPSAKAFGDMPSLLAQGLTRPVDGVAPLAEGKMAEQMMQRRIGDFQSFLGEMNNGLMAIANAAQVVAYCYDDTDGEAGATIGDVSFAFGYEGAQKPDGFDNRLLYNGNVTTMQQLQALAAGSGAYAGSNAGLYGDRDAASLAYSTPYGSKWEWSDGSSMTSSNRVEIGPNGAQIYVTTYTVYDKDGNVVGTRTERSNYDAGSGSRTDSTEISSNGTTFSNDTTTHDDGRVTTTSTTTMPDAEGNPTTSTTTHESTPGDHSSRDPDDQGPVENAMDTYDSRGDENSQRLYGMDY